MPYVACSFEVCVSELKSQAQETAGEKPCVHESRCPLKPGEMTVGRMSHIALHAALITCTTPSSLAHLRGRNTSLPRLASWRSRCTRRAVDRFEMSQLQSSGRSQHNLPQAVVNKNRVGNGSGRGTPELFDMLVSAAYLPSFVLCNSTSASSIREGLSGFLVASSVHSSILWSPLVPGRPLGAYSLSVYPCL